MTRPCSKCRVCKGRDFLRRSRAQKSVLKSQHVEQILTTIFLKLKGLLRFLSSFLKLLKLLLEHLQHFLRLRGHRRSSVEKPSQKPWHSLRPPIHLDSPGMHRMGYRSPCPVEFDWFRLQWTLTVSLKGSPQSLFGGPDGHLLLQEKGTHALPETQVLTDLSADVLENVKAPLGGALQVCASARSREHHSRLKLLFSSLTSCACSACSLGPSGY